MDLLMRTRSVRNATMSLGTGLLIACARRIDPWIPAVNVPRPGGHGAFARHARSWHGDVPIGFRKAFTSAGSTDL